MRRCCTTMSTEGSDRESMRLDRRHEQAVTRSLSHDELVQLHCYTATLLHCFPSQARAAADLAGQEDDLGRATERQSRSPRGTL